MWLPIWWNQQNTALTSGQKSVSKVGLISVHKMKLHSDIKMINIQLNERI